MSQGLWQTAIERAGRLAAPLALDELPDADLLGRFLTARDEPAFAAIVRRHGPLVWGVCRGLSPSEADAEDAFQATFLALFRSASKVRKANALGAWLHRVAGRVCRNGLRTKARRARRERLAAKAEASQPLSEAAWDRWQEAVHAEIDRLPDTLRVPFVLCVLQGVRQGEAAKRLGWKLGTVSGRVCLAKQSLANSIARRGLTGPAVLAALAGSGMMAGPLTAGLVSRGSMVVRSAAGLDISTTVHELARGAMGGAMSKIKLLAFVVLAGGITVGAVGTQYPGTADAQVPGGGPPGVGAVGKSGPGAVGLGGDGQKGGPGGVGVGGPGAMPGMPGGATGGSGRGGFGSAPVQKIEYRYQGKPSSPENFKSLLTMMGNEGWEYVGLVPGSEEMIFKRTPQPMLGGSMSGGGFGSMPGLGGGGGFGGGMAPPGFPGGGVGGASGGAGQPGKGGGGGSGSGRPGAGAGAPGGIPPGAGLGGGGGDALPGTPEAGPAKQSDQVELKIGETIRHRMNNRATIERVFVKDARCAEVSPDPTDARRVLIKSIQTGSTELELTDAGGVKEKFTIRVK